MPFRFRPRIGPFVYAPGQRKPPKAAPIPLTRVDLALLVISALMLLGACAGALVTA